MQGNHTKLEEFLNAAAAGSGGSAVVHEIHSDGGIGRYKYSYDGKDMYVLFTKAAWSDDAEDGGFRYLGNKILDDGISNIPEYQYRIVRE